MAKGEASDGLRCEAPELREVGWRPLALQGQTMPSPVPDFCSLHQPWHLWGRQAGLPAHQHPPPATEIPYLPPSASGLVLSQHITAFPISHSALKHEVGAACLCQTQPQQQTGAHLQLQGQQDSLSQELAPWHNILFKPGCLGRNLVGFQHLEIVLLAPAGAQNQWELKADDAAVNERHPMAVAHPWRSCDWLGCDSYNLHGRSSGVDPDAKSSKSLPWEAEPFSSGAGVEQVIEATLTIPSAWRWLLCPLPRGPGTSLPQATKSLLASSNKSLGSGRPDPCSGAAGAAWGVQFARGAQSLHSSFPPAGASQCSQLQQPSPTGCSVAPWCTKSLSVIAQGCQSATWEGKDVYWSLGHQQEKTLLPLLPVIKQCLSEWELCCSYLKEDVRLRNAARW